jgi:hypothetical protein
MSLNHLCFEATASAMMLSGMSSGNVTLGMVSRCSSALVKACMPGAMGGSCRLAMGGSCRLAMGLWRRLGRLRRMLLLLLLLQTHAAARHQHAWLASSLAEVPQQPWSEALQQRQHISPQ